jgi:hypothetical protein
VQPTNNTHFVGEDKLSSTGGEVSSFSQNLGSQHVISNLHFRDRFFVNNLNSVISGGNQSSSCHYYGIVSKNNLKIL